MKAVYSRARYTIAGTPADRGRAIAEFGFRGTAEEPRVLEAEVLKLLPSYLKASLVHVHGRDGVCLIKPLSGCCAPR